MAHDGSREGSDSALTTVRTVPSSGCVKNWSIPIGTYSSPNSSLDPGPDEGPDKAPDEAPDEAPVATEPPVAVSSVSCFRGDGSVGTVVVFVFVVIVVIIAVVALVLGGGDAIIGGEGYRGLVELGVALASSSPQLATRFSKWFSGVDPPRFSELFPLHFVLVWLRELSSSCMVIFDTGVLVISRRAAAAADTPLLAVPVARLVDAPVAAAAALAGYSAAIDLFLMEGELVEEDAMFLFDSSPSNADELSIP
jgi:hypothetical protein